MSSPIGYVLHRDRLRIAVLTLKTTNRKIGPMAQVWIIPSAMSPISAIRTGDDKVVCGSCPMRGTKGKERSCYVNIMTAQSVWRAWNAKRYDALPFARYPQVLPDLFIRWGAWGDPGFLPLDIIASVNHYAIGWVGYTRLWRSHPALKQYFMASTLSLIERAEAVRLGWRTFRVYAQRKLPDACRDCLPQSHGACYVFRLPALLRDHW